MENESKARVTQKDVAREAGVSHVTVSLALRGRREIPIATRKRIDAIARRLGYSPDPLFQTLSAYRQSRRPSAFRSNLAWINNYHVPAELTRQEGYRLYYEGAKQRAMELGYGLETVNLCEYHYNRRSIERMLDARGIRGLLIAPVQDHHDRIDLDWSRYSAVRFGYSMTDTILHTVAASQYRASFIAVEHLAGLGYRKIGYIHEQEFNVRTGGHFLGGFLSARRHFGLSDLPVLALSVPEGKRENPDWRLARTWFEKEKPDAVIIVAWDVLPQLKQWGFRVPGDVGVASLSVSENESELSGIHQNERAVGAASCNLLVSLLDRQETGIPDMPMHLLIEGAWRDGRTTIPPGKKIRQRGRVSSARTALK